MKTITILSILFTCVSQFTQAQIHNQDNNSTSFYSGNNLFSLTRHFDGLSIGQFDPVSNKNVMFLGGSHGSRGLAWNALEDIAGDFRYTANTNAFKMDFSNWNNYAVWRFSDNTPGAGNVITWQTAMQLQKQPTGIGLRLCGDFYAKEININSGIGWCDYVFAKDYRLRSLENLQVYIDTYKHLPDVPSEKEVFDNGIAVTEMLQIQMKKIEELTLYTLQQQKEIDELKALLTDK
ncbi:MAG: hypothetical protein ACJAXV_001804 [Bacteroidia bacterium]|jgi:hypothetical protein